MTLRERVPTPFDLNLAATGVPVNRALPARVGRADDLQDALHGRTELPRSADDMLGD